MMKRVWTTRFSFGSLLLAAFLLAGSVSLPAFAREDMSNGQSGDPNDGEDVFADGGGTIQDQMQSDNKSDAGSVRSIPVLIPVVVSGSLLFFIIVIREPIKMGS